jgi:hypothetical protein
VEDCARREAEAQREFEHALELDLGPELRPELRATYDRLMRLDRLN